MRQVFALEHAAMAISREERTFFVALGERIARLRKDSHITQVQLAETLDIAQSTVNAYESEQRRVPVSAFPVLPKALGVSLDELLGEETNAVARKRGPTPKLQQQVERLSRLPKTKQRVVMEMLEGLLSQAAR